MTPAKPVAARVEYVDMTPTWSGLLPALLAAYEHGSAASRTIALDELTRLAEIADRAVADAKADRAVRVYHVVAASTVLGTRAEAEDSPIFTGEPVEAADYLRGLPLGQSVEVRHKRGLRSCMNKPALWEWVESLTA